jgi:hypothetical protein
VYAVWCFALLHRLQDTIVAHQKPIICLTFCLIAVEIPGTVLICLPACLLLA